jgi:hypothetical protein
MTTVAEYQLLLSGKMPATIHRMSPGAFAAKAALPPTASLMSRAGAFGTCVLDGTINPMLRLWAAPWAGPRA